MCRLGTFVLVGAMTRKVKFTLRRIGCMKNSILPENAKTTRIVPPQHSGMNPFAVPTHYRWVILSLRGGGEDITPRDNFLR